MKTLILSLILMVSVPCMATGWFSYTPVSTSLLAQLADCWLCDSSCPCAREWDLNRDGIVNFIDFAIYVDMQEERWELTGDYSK